MRATRANSVFALILVTPQIEIDLIFPKSVNVELHIVNNRDTNGHYCIFSSHRTY